MTGRSFMYLLIIVVLSASGCIKETYDMNKLSDNNHIYPTIAISAVKGNLMFSDIVEPDENVKFDQEKLVRIIFEEDSVITLTYSDFYAIKGMGPFSDPTATLEPYTLNTGIDDYLNHSTGNVIILNPVMKVNFRNSFGKSVRIDLDISGKRDAKTVNLKLPVYSISAALPPDYYDVDTTIIIDKSNSLDSLLSLPPQEITLSGTAALISSATGSPGITALIPGNILVGSVDVEIPLELRVKNLVLADTVNNFLADDESWNDSPAKPESFKLLRVELRAKNGFPFEVSAKMGLYNSATHSVISSVEASDILKPAAVDNNGKVTGATETTVNLEFSTQFFNSITSADKIVFQFTLNSTADGTKDIKIYSDYRLDFNTSVVVTPDIKLK